MSGRLCLVRRVMLGDCLCRMLLRRCFVMFHVAVYSWLWIA